VKIKTKYYINAIHKTCGTFNEFTYDEKMAKRLALGLMVGNHFSYIEVSVNQHYSEYYLRCLNREKR